MDYLKLPLLVGSLLSLQSYERRKTLLFEEKAEILTKSSHLRSLR